ncbi:hypothetical protein QS306_10225 [Paraburkholderia bonniea]|uniref:protein YgfX n=1 Tax=Paraburkholderia bonniea TaxID=2152891 RepID=UPI001290CD70|nr:protein YgfX [Paraburkholderia bonniea]WJF89491.1 hypothetical protein QS306_10225 [Paraburkholderia bonniea]WJF92806.1 hypothetical protein QS308_10235 [Paraburkholderia bonniea]
MHLSPPAASVAALDAGAVLVGDGAQAIPLRPSLLLDGAAALFIVVATAALYQTVVPRFGFWQVLLAVLATLAVLLASALRLRRAQPAVLKMGPDWLAAWSGAGVRVAYGRIVACSQWSGWLLMIVLVGENGRSRMLLIPADTLGPLAFRELAVLARRRSNA